MWQALTFSRSSQERRKEKSLGSKAGSLDEALIWCCYSGEGAESPANGTWGTGTTGTGAEVEASQDCLNPPYQDNCPWLGGSSRPQRRPGAPRYLNEAGEMPQSKRFLGQVTSSRPEPGLGGLRTASLIWTECWKPEEVGCLESCGWKMKKSGEPAFQEQKPGDHFVLKEQTSCLGLLVFIVA